jgi:hypothetical protein
MYFESLEEFKPRKKTDQLKKVEFYTRKQEETI